MSDAPDKILIEPRLLEGLVRIASSRRYGASTDDFVASELAIEGEALLGYSVDNYEPLTKYLKPKT